MQPLNDFKVFAQNSISELIKPEILGNYSEEDAFQVISEIINEPKQMTFGVNATWMKYKKDKHWLAKALQMLIVYTLSSSKAAVSHINADKCYEALVQQIQSEQILVQNILNASLQDQQIAKQTLFSYLKTDLQSLEELSYYKQQNSRLNVICLRISKAPQLHAILKFLIQRKLKQISNQNLLKYQIMLLGVKCQIEKKNKYEENVSFDQNQENIEFEIIAQDQCYAMLSGVENQMKLKLWSNQQNKKFIQKSNSQLKQYRGSTMMSVEQAQQKYEQNKVKNTNMIIKKDSIQESQSFDSEAEENLADLQNNLLKKQHQSKEILQLQDHNKNLFKSNFTPGNCSLRQTKQIQGSEKIKKFFLNKQLKSVLKKINGSQSIKIRTEECEENNVLNIKSLNKTFNKLGSSSKNLRDKNSQIVNNSFKDKNAKKFLSSAHNIIRIPDNIFKPRYEQKDQSPRGPTNQKLIQNYNRVPNITFSYYPLK